MALRRIVTKEDPILRRISRKVEKFDKRLWDLLDDMKETLADADGAGLAAVQVGVLRRVVIVDVGDGLLELINPEITDKSEDFQEEAEGCLSIPGEYGITRRPQWVIVKAQNREGKWVLYKGEGLKARCFCHELDHLDGILYTDNVIEMLDEDDL